MKKKLAKGTAVLLAAALLLTGCGAGSGDSASSGQTEAQSAGQSTNGESSTITNSNATSVLGGLILTADDINIKDSDYYSTDWQDEDYTEINSDNVSDYVTNNATDSANGKSVTITEEGTYVLSGTINYTVTINVADTEKVTLILDGVTITSSDGPAIYVESADKVTISTTSGSKNTLEDGSTRSDEELDGVIYSTADLVLNGEGTLTIKANFGDGIHSTDDLRITGGTYDITAADDGLSGKDRVEIVGGTFTIDAEAKGIKATNDEEEDKGFIFISGGTFDIDSGDDGIHGPTAIWIIGGTFTINSGDDGIHADETLVIGGGNITVASSVEGIEAPEIFIEDGTVTIYASDDGINAAGGALTGATTTSGATSGTTTTSGSTSAVSTGTSGTTLAVSTLSSAASTDSDASVSTDTSVSIDAVNGTSLTTLAASDGTDSDTVQTAGPQGGGQMPGGMSGQQGGQMPGGDMGGMQGGFGGDGMASSSSGYLTISGGTIYVNADGDGLDANTSITQTGGDVVVEGPSNDGNGILDYDSSYIMTGGTLQGFGSSGMLQSISDGSSVSAIVVYMNQSSGKTITVKDSDGNTVLETTLSKSAACGILASEDFVSGETYTVYSGSSEIGSVTISGTSNVIR